MYVLVDSFDGIQSSSLKSFDTIHASKIVLFSFSATILGKNRSIISLSECHLGAKKPPSSS